MNKIWKFILRPSLWMTQLIVIVVVTLFIWPDSISYLKVARDFLDSEPFVFNSGKIRVSVFLIFKVLMTIAILFWSAGVASRFTTRKIRVIRGIRASKRALIIKTLQILFYFLAFVISLDILGIDLTALTIFSGAVGIGIGFGLQKITSNFISGIILLFEQSVENNDLIELTDGTYGSVRHTGARYTLIETLDGKEIMIPNEDLIVNRVTNWTHTNEKGRITIEVGVHYESDLDKVHDIIIEAAMSHPQIITEPAPVCYLREFADSSVNFVLLMWIDDISEWRHQAHSDVMFSVWRKFKENNIQIPYPQRDVHIKTPGKSIK